MNTRPWSVVSSLLLAAPLAAQTPAPAVREDLEVLGTALERAVAKVSRPTRAVMASRGVPRGYRLPGYGAMIVLAPRTLPVPAAAGASERQAVRALAIAAEQLQQSLRTVQSEEARQQIQQHLKALRESEAALRAQGPAKAAAAPPAPAADAAKPAPARDLASLEREQAELAREAEAMARAASARGDMDLFMQEQLDRELRAFYERAEALRLQAARAFQQLSEGQAPVGSAQPQSPSSPGTPVADSPETAPELGPWQSWLDLEIEDPAASAASPEQVIEGVRAAITSVLESQGARLKALGPEDVVAVAVDFIPATRMSFRPTGQKTVVVRVAKKHIDARQSGRLSPAEFRKRVVVLEY
jgi:hypothetical protein